MSALDIAKKLLILREGLRSVVYLDSVGLETAGIGHLLTHEEKAKYPLGFHVPADVIDNWFVHDVDKAYHKAMDQAEDLKMESDDFIAALISVNFQLGDFAAKFRDTYALLKRRKFDDVIRHLKISRWFHQTPVRTEDFISAIKRLQAQL